MYRLFFFVSLAVLLQSCVAVSAPSTPTTTKNGVKPHADFRKKYADRLSVDNIKRDREQVYAQKHESLKRLNPIQDAQRAGAADDYYFLAYQTGRGGILKTPGLTQQQSTNKRCGLRLLDGMGDVIYGDNHQKYRKALRHYAEQFNKTMFSFCR